MVKEWGDRKWRQSEPLLRRPGGLKISVGEGAKTGVLSRETKWSKRRRWWGDLELVLLSDYKVAK